MARLKKKEFVEKLSKYKEKELREMMWKIYYRAPETVRVRVEDLLRTPDERKIFKEVQDNAHRKALEQEIEEFVTTVRKGHYKRYSRHVARKYRKRWRFVFKRLLDDSTKLAEKGDVEVGLMGLETLLDLAYESFWNNYFHSDDPMKSMKVVFSDRVSLLWRARLSLEGFRSFAKHAAIQLIKWDSRFGWTYSETLKPKEAQLSHIVSSLIKGADAWLEFAEAYLDGLNQIYNELKKKADEGVGKQWLRDRIRTYDIKLSDWNEILITRLSESGEDEMIEKIIQHKLFGPAQRKVLKAIVEEV